MAQSNGDGWVMKLAGNVAIIGPTWSAINLYYQVSHDLKELQTQNQQFNKNFDKVQSNFDKVNSNFDKVNARFNFAGYFVIAAPTMFALVVLLVVPRNPKNGPYLPTN